MPAVPSDKTIFVGKESDPDGEKVTIEF